MSVDLPTYDDVCALKLDNETFMKEECEARRMAATLAIIDKAHPLQHNSLVSTDCMVIPINDNTLDLHLPNFVPAVPGWYVHNEAIRVNKTNVPMRDATSYHIAIPKDAMASSPHALRFIMECLFLWRIPVVVTGHDTYELETVSVAGYIAHGVY
jgi:hypothetical protein